MVAEDSVWPSKQPVPGESSYQRVRVRERESYWLVTIANLQHEHSQHGQTAMEEKRAKVTVTLDSATLTLPHFAAAASSFNCCH